MRVMAANYLANSGKEWISIFETLNSGTYCNEWVIVDMKLFSPSEAIRNGTLMVAEQLPGSVTSADESARLDRDRFYPSLQYPRLIRTCSVCRTSPNWRSSSDPFSTTRNTLAPKIFQRDHSKVKDLATMKRIMRYNDYKNDELSAIVECEQAEHGKCDPPRTPYYAIASRKDLCIPGNISNYGIMWSLLNPRCNGGTDAKIASWSGMRGTNMTGYIVSGPTSDNQPPFEWSSPVCQKMWATTEGLNKVFNFDWQVVHTTGRTVAVVSPSDSNSAIMLVCLFVILAAVVAFVVLFWVHRRTVGAEYKQIQSA